MASTFFGLGIGTSGLLTYQAAINVTANNISNAQTDGYSRQELVQSAARPVSVGTGYGMLGSGVIATDIIQIRDQYYDEKYRTNSATYGEYSTKEKYMTEVENYFNDLEKDGFTTCFSYLSTSLQELLKDPTSLSVRTQVINYSENLTDYFKSIAKNLQSIQEDCNNEIKSTIDRINSIGEQLAVLTKQINTVEINGVRANELRDQRELLIDELSQYCNVSVKEVQAGTAAGVNTYSVKINGQTLVDTYESNSLACVPRSDSSNLSDIDGLYDVTWDNGNQFKLVDCGGTLQSLYEVRDGNNKENLTGKVTGEAGDTTITMTGASINDIAKLNINRSGFIQVGSREYEYTSFDIKVEDDGTYTYTFELASGLKSNVDNVSTSIGEAVDYKGIAYYQSELNEFARTFSSAFNEILNGGVDLNGDTGKDLFNATSPTTGDNYEFSEDKTSFDINSSYYNMTALNFNINKEIVADVSKLATASSVTDGVSNTEILNKLIGCLEDKSMFNQGTPASFLQALIAEIGIDTSKAKEFSESQKNILSSIDNQRLSEMGVDEDEEAVNLITYQSAYNYSAKVIQVMSEVLDKLINETGV